jgi:hypothetical protein
MKRLIAIVSLSICLAGCAHSRSISRDNLRDQFTIAISIASESLWFADAVENGHTTVEYARQHPLYLADEIQDSLGELTHSKAAPDLQPRLSNIQDQLRRLQRALFQMSGDFKTGRKTSAEVQRILAIRAQLQSAKAAL